MVVAFAWIWYTDEVLLCCIYICEMELIPSKRVVTQTLEASLGYARALLVSSLK